MKILVVSYDFYPDNLPNSFRWEKIISEMCSKGYDVTVLSARKGNREFVQSENLANVTIYRSGEFGTDSYRYPYLKESSEIKGSSEVLESGGKRIKSLVRKSLKAIYDRTWKFLYWPDHSFLWYLKSKGIVSNIVKQHSITHVITVSWPFSSHMLGLEIKKKFPGIFWLADTIDPFALSDSPNNMKIYRKLNKHIERRVFLEADFNTVLTNHIKESYIDKFGVSNKKISVVNNMFLPSLPSIDNMQNILSVKKNHFRFSFIGTLNRDVRSPDLCLSFFRKLKDTYPDIAFRVDFYGNISDCQYVFENYPDLLNQVVFIHGVVPKLEVENIIVESDVLVNIGNQNEYQEPSKLIEYIFYRKKILNFHTLKNDTSKALLSKYDLKLNISYEDVGDSSFYDIFQSFLNNKRLSQIDDDFFEPYALETIVDKYITILEDK